MFCGQFGGLYRIAVTLLLVKEHKYFYEDMKQLETGVRGCIRYDALWFGFAGFAQSRGIPRSVSL